MQLILSYLYGELEYIPQDSLPSLLLATDRFEVHCPCSWPALEHCPTHLCVDGHILQIVSALRSTQEMVPLHCTAQAMIDDSDSDQHDRKASDWKEHVSQQRWQCSASACRACTAGTCQMLSAAQQQTMP